MAEINDKEMEELKKLSQTVKSVSGDGQSVTFASAKEIAEGIIAMRKLKRKRPFSVILMTPGSDRD